MKPYFEIVIGLILMILTAYITLSYDRVFLAVMRFVYSGLLVGFFFLGVGLILLGLSDLKE